MQECMYPSLCLTIDRMFCPGIFREREKLKEERRKREREKEGE